MVAEQIINKSIRSIFQRHIVGNKGKVFFRISTGSISDPKPYPIHEKGLEYTGEDKFMDILEEAYDEKPHYLGIELFRKAEKNLKKDPFAYKKVTIEENVTNPEGNLGLGSFGGLEGVIQAKISGTILENQNKDYTQKIAELKAEKIRQERTIKELDKLVSNLKETIKEKDWDIKYLKTDHENHISGIHSKNDKFEKLLTVGGVVAAKLAGLDEADLRGILDVDDKLEKLDHKTNSAETDIDFEENKNYQGSKLQAKQYADTIHANLIQLIDRNSDENALNAMISIKSVTDYIFSDIQNLQAVINYIVQSQNGNQSGTAADNIIKQVNKYKTDEQWQQQG